MPFSAASALPISMNNSGCSSASQGSQRLIAPARYISVSRYVVMTCGYFGSPTLASGFQGLPADQTLCTGLI